MNASEYHERTLQCMAAIDAHNAARLSAHSAKNLCAFNLSIETLIIGGSTYVGWKSFLAAREEASFIRALTGNSVMLRVFNPVPLTMGLIVCLTGVFAASDASRMGALRRMEQMQALAASRASEELDRLKASRNSVA